MPHPHQADFCSAPLAGAPRGTPLDDSSCREARGADALLVITPSTSEEDIVRSYGPGASSFIITPITFDSAAVVMSGPGSYGTGIVQFPPAQ